MIVPGDKQHWEAIKAIYIEGMNTGNATFEKPNSLNTYKNWIQGKIAHSLFIYQQGNEVLGWVVLSPVSSRNVYAGVVELSIYVASQAQGKGVGSALMQQVINYAESQHIWTIQTGIFPENETSLQLHKKFGFREIGVREKIGKMDGKWRDVILIERRSKNIF